MYHAQQRNDVTVIKRALGAIAKILISTKRFPKALDVLLKKLHVVKTEEADRAWILHDIGCCYFELERFEKALNYAKESLNLASKTKEQRCTLSSHILLAKTLSLLKSKEKSMQYYKKAKAIAESLNDLNAQTAIDQAIGVI